MAKQVGDGKNHDTDADIAPDLEEARAVPTQAHIHDLVPRLAARLKTMKVRGKGDRVYAWRLLWGNTVPRIRPLTP